MRPLAICALLALVSAPCWSAEEGLDDLKARADRAGVEDCPSICIQVAQYQLRNADRLYTEGNVDQARTAVGDIVTYSQKASEAAKESRKHLKNVEIAVRRMSEKLRDIKRTLNFEDQPPVEEATKRLEDMRTALLQEMFKKEKK